MAATTAVVGLWTISDILKQKTTFSRMLSRPLPRPRPDFCTGGAQGNLKYLVALIVRLAWRGSTNINLTLIFPPLVFFIETIWRLVVDRNKLHLELSY